MLKKDAGYTAFNMNPLCCDTLWRGLLILQSHSNNTQNVKNVQSYLFFPHSNISIWSFPALPPFFCPAYRLRSVNNVLIPWTFWKMHIFIYLLQRCLTRVSVWKQDIKCWPQIIVLCPWQTGYLLKSPLLSLPLCWLQFWLPSLPNTAGDYSRGAVMQRHVMRRQIYLRAKSHCYSSPFGNFPALICWCQSLSLCTPVV